MRKLPIDSFLLMLMATVAIAAVIPVRGEMAEWFGILVHIAIAALFFLYGAKLSPKAVGEGLLHWRLQTLVLAATYVVFPLLGLATVFLMRDLLPDELLTGVLFLTLLPSTVQSSVAFTSIARGNVAAALTSASLSNLLGVIATPLLVALVIGGAGGGISLDSVLDLALQLVLPVVVGQLARRWIGAWLASHKPITSVVDRGSILLVVYAAFSEGMVDGVWSQVSWSDLAWLVVISVVLLAIILAITALAGKWLGFNREDRIAILFCGSKKSLATGIPMAGVLFAGSAVPLIVLPLMLFHQIQLFACAILAQRYARDPVTPAPAVPSTDAVATKA